VVLIHPAEAMNKNAANSLLKTLEEPTDKLLFILVSHKPQQLQPTILSRCLGFMLPTPSRDVGTAWLKSHGVTNPDNALAQTGFAPLLALDWAESGVGSEERSILLDEMTQPERLDALDLADRLQRSTPVHVIHCLQQWCYDITSVKLAGSVRYFPEKIDVILNLANSVNLDALLRTNKELQDARRNALHPLNSRLFLESIFLSYRHIFTD
jgi:DNA polymerase-3 subunit delta'